MRMIFLFIALTLVFASLSFAAEKADEKWKGIDEAVIEKIAKEHGREAKDPLINTDTGDMLLFVFLVAGAIGGFMAGYYWRVLTEPKTILGSPGTEPKGGLT